MLAMFNKPSVFYLFLLNRNLCLNHGPIQSCCCLLIRKINLLGITILISKPACIITSPLLGRREGEEALLPRRASRAPCLPSLVLPPWLTCPAGIPARTQMQHGQTLTLSSAFWEAACPMSGMPHTAKHSSSRRRCPSHPCASLWCWSHSTQGCGEGT